MRSCFGAAAVYLGGPDRGHADPEAHARTAAPMGHDDSAESRWADCLDASATADTLEMRDPLQRYASADLSALFARTSLALNDVNRRISQLNQGLDGVDRCLPPA